MKFHVLTLFPEMINGGLNTSITGRAISNNLIQVNAVNIRDYTTDKHGKVDDYTYGGGAGMLMQAQPVYDAWKSVCGEKKLRTVYVTPQGYPFTQKMALDFAKEEELVFLCGHYEGIDERVLEETVTDFVSIGDYVLTGGELPAMVMIDAISRLVPGVLNNEDSACTESFHKDLLEYPQYSRPESWHGKEVPKELLTGNHKIIGEWRRMASEERTRIRRPDLYKKYLENQKILQRLMKNKKENAYLIDGLLRGLVDIVANEKDAILGYHREGDMYMLCADNLAAGEKMVQALVEQQDKKVRLMVHNCEGLSEVLQKQLGLKIYADCYQVVYTQKNAMPVKHKDIRLLSMDELDYAVTHYHDGESRKYLTERIKNKKMYGAFVDGNIAGFIGFHDEGSVGILYVDEAYRREHIGSSMTAFMMNKAMEREGFPFAHVILDNTASKAMCDHLGLYTAKCVVTWMGQ